MLFGYVTTQNEMDDDMDDLYSDSTFEDSNQDDLFRSPNDGAYEKEEVRSGPPLDYVAEKFRRSLELTHSLVNFAQGMAIADEEGKARMLSSAQGSLRYQLTGYLALKNMLALVNDEHFFDRMETCSASDFQDWLDRIDQQGSVLG